MNPEIIKVANCSISQPYSIGYLTWYTTTLKHPNTNQIILRELQWDLRQNKLHPKRLLKQWTHSLQALPADFHHVPYTSLSQQAQSVVKRVIHITNCVDRISIDDTDPIWNNMDIESLKTLKNDLRKMDQSFYGKSSRFQWEIYQKNNGVNVIEIDTTCLHSIHWDSTEDPINLIKAPLDFTACATKQPSAVKLYTHTDNVKIENPFVEDTEENQSFIPRCPTCGSTNLRKITTGQKALSVWAFGLLSQKVKRQFKCNNCGYEW